MLLKKGLNRIFIVLSIISFFAGSIIGFGESNVYKKPKAKDVFSSFDWNDITINRYYEFARRKCENLKDLSEYNRKYNDNLDYKKSEFKRNILELDRVFLSQWQSMSTDLPNFKNNPPQFNADYFSKTFPESMKSQPPKRYKIVLTTLLFGIVFFSVCYGGLHLISYTIFWVLNGFKKEK